ncbi:MlaD family protein [Patulibacter brassicae]|jgi:ABC-type transporter Mla subunit MlaD|uniref:MlaD family protein n=1 Tax=Patulibacter brassicae TaxID=1705717 RepID=A0ABU4VNT9_9ACTN|nr:MlaD family protein [Patulibacter brassicae]MDX8153105.1 MlaD family protein [Patulibacter brassicae]
MSARRRILAGALALLALGTTTSLAACGGDGGDDGAYRVRATFGNAFAVIPGEEVRIAGARVGTVEDVDVDRERRAVLVLRIDDAGFRDFRRDAECSIRPQSIIGERFVECTPTQPRTTGSAPPPALRTATFDGQRQHLLPVANTVSPVDLDLVAGMMRLPERERTAVFLNSLGVGLAARGPELRRAIRAALPGLRETDRVLALLGDQNQQLRALVRDSDTALQPVARERDRLTRLLARAADVQGAVGEQRAALDRDLRLLPGTLRELRPTMAELSRLSRQGTPLLRDLRSAAPAGAELLRAAAPFSRRALRPIQDLGETADVARVALRRADPVVAELQRVATTTRGILDDARPLTQSLEDSGGFRRVLDYIFFQTLAVNAYDDAGHYLRINLIVNQCSAYATTPTVGCSAALGGATAGARSARGGRRSGESPEMALTRRVLAGEDPATVLREARGSAAYRPLLRRLAAMRALQAAGTRGTAAPTTGTDDDPIDVRGSLLPGGAGDRAPGAGEIADDAGEAVGDALARLLGEDR